MDLVAQEEVKRLSEVHGVPKLAVVLGAPDPESAEIAAETFIFGDPAYAGALAGVQLDLDVYHVLEDEIRERIPDHIWEEQIGVMEDVLDRDGLIEAVTEMRRRRDDGLGPPG